MSSDFLERWAHQDERAQVALLSAPGTFPPVPSIALSIFQTALDEAGISSKVIYASFPMTYRLGTDTINVLRAHMDFFKNTEYFFAHLTDVSASVPLKDFVRACTYRIDPDCKYDEFMELLADALVAAEEIVEATATRIVRMGAKVLAATSVYAQQCPTLAILRRVKELDPSITTLVGGFNTTDEMGINLLRHFPSVDYVCFGEGDEIIVEAVTTFLGCADGPLPYGILSRAEPLPEHAPYRMTRDLNTVPTPDYRDFFEEIQREADGFYGAVAEYRAQTYESTIFLEGSRGCWWGARRPCSFCGLNGLTNVYREKAPELLFREIAEAADRHPGVRIQLSDNVLGHRMVRELLPMLAKDPQDCRLFCEIRTNLDSCEVQALARAGIVTTQPGIESLNDHLLRLMGKGSTAIQNVALMKYHRAHHIYPVWNMMTSVPGEAREDYEQMLELIPLITHLQPPTRANPIVFMRFSRYWEDPEAYGLELAPDPLYQCCFDDHKDIVDDFGCYSILTGGSFVETIQANHDLYLRMHRAVTEWRQLFYSKDAPKLIVSDTGFGLVILDTRPGAPQQKRILFGLAAEIYRLAWEPVSTKDLAERIPNCTEEKVRITCDNLVADKLMVFLSGKYLALAVPVNT